MKLILTALSVLALTGCAATDYTGAEDPAMSYFLVSKGGASGVIQWLSGGVQYCKITQKNLGATDFNVTVQYDGDACLVDATTSDKDTEVQPNP